MKLRIKRSKEYKIFKRRDGQYILKYRVGKLLWYTHCEGYTDKPVTFDTIEQAKQLIRDTTRYDIRRLRERKLTKVWP